MLTRSNRNADIYSIGAFGNSWIVEWFDDYGVYNVHEFNSRINAQTFMIENSL